MTQQTAAAPPAFLDQAELFVPGNVWAEMGDRPHDALVARIARHPIVWLQTHQVPGHSPMGAWAVTSAELMRQVLLDTATFTSLNTTSLSLLLGGNIHIVPIEADPPEHAKYRAVIADYFKPRSINALADAVRRRADALLDEIIPLGGCDFVERFARILPASIFLDLFGLPQEEMPQFLAWSTLVTTAPSAEERAEAMRSIRDYLQAEVVRRRAKPADDLLNCWANGMVDGRPATDAETIGGVMLLFVAGLDTVASIMGWMFRHLAETPGDQLYLREDPGRISGTLDEFLRFFATVTLNRRATRDVELGGVRIRKGDIVTCPTTVASRDPREFDNADEIDLRSGRRRHFAFGYGAHTCIGLHLARLELKVALEQWLARVPPFRVAQPEGVSSHGGTVLALDALPLAWDRDA